MSALPVHKCSDPECCSFGQITSKSCGCHKTTEQLLVEQRDELLAALKDIVAGWDAVDPHAYVPDEINDDDAWEAARAAIAKAEDR